MKVDGTVAFITGGARGIGRAICESLLHKGGKVCFVDLDGELGNKTETELKATFPKSDVLFLRCDVTKQEDFVEAYKKAELRFGTIGILVNNAGILLERNWSRMIDVNLKGVIEGTYVALEHMSKDKGGRGGVIINISSVAGVQPFPYTPVYSAAKAAVVAFTLAWAKDESDFAIGECKEFYGKGLSAFPDEDHFKKHGVRLNVICPLLVDTEMVKNARSEVFELDKYLETAETYTKMAPSRIGDVVIQILENEQDSGKILVVSPESVYYHEMAQLSNTNGIDEVKVS